MTNFKSVTFFSVLLSCLLVSKAEKVEVVVEGATSIAQTDEDFICVTLDWWPTNKCDYDLCPWGQAGLFNLDLKNKILEKAIKAFHPLRIRVGGSLQDQNCQPFQKQVKGFLFGFSIGCLDMKSWDELNEFFNQTRAKVTFGLNSEAKKTLWVGDWYSYNAQELMSYTISKGYKIDSYELGLKLNNMKEMYPNPKTQPKVLGPGGNNPDVVRYIQDLFFLTQTAQTFKDVLNAIDKFAPWSGGGAYNCGGQLVSYTFAFGFW
ncbi:hypothetical protein GOBAR_AA32886 [Gossypium barbadense]|uniref:Heparanase-like protein 2 n=1 Tax=Gossypium barbadense TaxID=3634 RepID=A0A2P5W9M9_GOSBA|nr:hypothetical protein GOBAR_AA32886 [Gossypium barbadense]